MFFTTHNTLLRSISKVRTLVCVLYLIVLHKAGPSIAHHCTTRSTKYHCLTKRHHNAFSTACSHDAASIFPCLSARLRILGWCLRQTHCARCFEFPNPRIFLARLITNCMAESEEGCARLRVVDEETTSRFVARIHPKVYRSCRSIEEENVPGRASKMVVPARVV
jgi:hypothetical protein